MKDWGQLESHKVNSKLAQHGEKPGPEPWQARTVKVTLEQNAVGEWMLRLNGGIPFLATDAEVAEWLELVRLRERVKVLELRTGERR